MAFNLTERFRTEEKSPTLLDPGAYQSTNPPLLHQNKVPFLSKSARVSHTTKIWSYALYNSDMPPKIPNCTSLISKVPRFPYEALSKDDMETIFCQCGVDNTCECDIQEDEKEIICQSKVQRRLFKGFTPKSMSGEEHSTLSKNFKSLEVLPNGTKIRSFENANDESPPFYDSRVIEATAFYQGCKWSKWTSKREQNKIKSTPGPADYTIEVEPSYEARCTEQLRALRRKTSKQYRFIESVQRRNVMEKKPGPAEYSPNVSKGTEMQWLGPKAERFAPTKYDVKPAPNKYFIKGAFETIEPPQKTSRVRLGAPAFFGIKAVRFKPRFEEGPSPASYDTRYKPSQPKCCNMAPFGSSSDRFKKQVVDDDITDNVYDILIESTIADGSGKSDSNGNNCEKKSWFFKSKTIRLKPLLQKLDEPSPADMVPTQVEVMRSRQLQYKSPFFSSEGRFQPWYNFIPVYGKEKTPGPGYYCLDKPKCLPAVISGPVFRTRRFPITVFQTPAPNAYKVNGGIETILTTSNQKLKNNIANRHGFHWSPPVEPQKLSLEAREAILLNSSIALLEVPDIFAYKKTVKETSFPSK